MSSALSRRIKGKAKVPIYIKYVYPACLQELPKQINSKCYSDVLQMFIL